jgi:hypothetical protein
MEIPQRRVRLPCGSNAKRLRDCAAYLGLTYVNPKDDPRQKTQ